MEQQSIRTHKNVVLLAATLGALVSPFLASAVNIAMPAIGADLQADAVSLSWVATAFILSSAASMLPAGRLADIFGRKRIFLLGTLITTIASLLCAAAQSIPVLLLFRVVQGIGSALFFSTSVPMLLSVFPPEERGKVIGFNTMVVYIGLSVGPMLGGMLTTTLGWRSVFYVIVPFNLIIMFAVLRFLKIDWAEARGERFRLKDTFLYMAALSLVIFGFSRLPGFEGFLLLAFGLVLFYLFGVLQMKGEHPLLDIKAIRHNRPFLLSSLAALISYSATYANTFYMSLYLQYIHGYSARTAGLVLIMQPAMQALFSSYAGKLSDRYDAGKIASIGMAITAGGLVMMIFLKASSSLVHVFIALAMLGLGFAFFSAPNVSVIMGSVPRKQHGVASGFVGTARQVGQAFSMSIATLIFALLIGNTGITPENHPAFLQSGHVLYLIMAVLCMVGIFASLARVRAGSHVGEANS